MVIAAIGDTGYNVMLVVHVLALIVAFAPAFVWPFVSRKLRTTGGADVSSALAKATAGMTTKIYGPALAIGGLVGFGLAGMSGKDANDELIYSVSDPWLSAAALIWFLLLGLFFGLLGPAEKRAAAGEESAAKIVRMSSGIIHLGVVVALYLMVFKPGA